MGDLISFVILGFFGLMIVGAFVYVWRHPPFEPSDDLRRADDEPEKSPSEKADNWVWRGGRGG